MNENEWTLKSFSNLVEIGKGSFSRVFSAIEIDTQK